MALQTAGKIKDKEGKLAEVQWDEKTNEIWVHWPGSFLKSSFTKKVPNEKAASAREALDRAYAWLHYQ